MGQLALFEGEIADVNDSGITLKNEKGQEKFKTVPAVAIFKDGPYEGTPSSDLKSLEIGKEVEVKLSFIDNEFKISVISYVKP